MEGKIKSFLSYPLPSLSKFVSKSVQESLFLISFATFSFGSWYMSTGFQTFLGLGYSSFKKIMYTITLVLLGAKLILQKYQVKNVIVIGILGCLFYLSSRYSASRTILWLFLFVISAQGISLIPVTFILLIVLILIGAITFGGYGFGAINDYILNAVGERSIRHSLGFAHPNTLAIYLYIFLCAFLTLKRWKIRWVDLCICFILTLFEYIMTGSRTSTLCFILTFAALIYLLFSRHVPKLLKDRINIFCIYATLALSYCAIVLSIFSLFFYNGNSSIWRLFNKIASGRLELMNGYYKDFGLTLFGRTYAGGKVYTFSARGNALTFVVDNMFASLILVYGLITGIIVIGILLISQIKLSKGPRSVFFGFSLFIIIGLVEKVGLHLEINFFLIAIGAVLYSEDLRVLISTDSILKHLALYRLLAGLPSAKRRGRHALETAPNEDKDFLERIQSKERQPAHVSKQ